MCIRHSLKQGSRHAALALLALLIASCALPKESAFQGSVSPTQARTQLLLDSADRALVVSGSITLTQGTATVELFSPAGGSVWKNTYSCKDTTEVTFPVGPYETNARPGEWTLVVQGNEQAQGSYALSLSNGR